MGPMFWKPDKSSKLKKCSEFRSDSCDLTETDGCCAVIPCTYCLTWEPYGAEIEYGTADFVTDSWVGSIAGAAFRAYWERGYESGECEFVVTIDGEEVYRNDCYGGQSCRDSSDSADDVTIGYDTGLLTWTKKEPRPLEYIDDPDAPGCKTWACGECECSCDCLCVTLPTGEKGEICDVSYPCDMPIWQGTIGAYELSIALGRDAYGNCIITPTVNGDTRDAVLAPGCGSLDVTFTLYDGSSVRVRCKECACDINPPCEWCCLPIDYSFPSYPLGVMADIPFSLTGCKSYDGIFRADPGNKPCSEELVYDDIARFNSPFLQTDPVTGYSESGGSCLQTPCSIPFVYKLECTARYAEPGDDNACDRLWLWIGTLGGTQVGDTGEEPGGHYYGPASWTRVRASSCMCDDSGVIASFDAGFTNDCSYAAVGTIGACAGQALNCCQISCAATLTI